MNVLFELIRSLNKQECRHFKLLANRTNQSCERKDILLFDYYRNTKNCLKDNKIAKKLYNNNRNAFYRLKGRLLTNLKTSLAIQYINKDHELSIYRKIFVSRLLKTKGNFNLSLSILLEAEKKAKKNNLPDVLSLIYNEIIALSHEKTDIDIELYLGKRRDNKKKINLTQEIDDLLAVLKCKLKKSQKYGENTPILKIIENTLNEYTTKQDLKKNPELKIKLYYSVSKILFQKNDFHSLEEFLTHRYSDFIDNKLFRKSNHATKLHMLNELVKCLYENENYNASIKRVKELKIAMQEYDKLYYDEYLFLYYNGLSINYSKTNKKKAITTLLEAKNEPVIKHSHYHYFLICSNLAMQYFDTKQLRLAIKTLSRIILHKKFLDFDISLRIKVICAELVIRYEIGDFDYLELKIKKTKKEYKNLIAEKKFFREKILLQILQKLIYTTQIKHNQSLFKDITLLLSKLNIKQAEEDDILNYNKWILTKL